MASTVKKDVGQSHGKRFRIVVSRLREGFRSVGKHHADVVADSSAGRRSLDENGGEGHSHRVLQRAEKTYAHKDVTETDENCVASK